MSELHGAALSVVSLAAQHNLHPKKSAHHQDQSEDVAFVVWCCAQCDTGYLLRCVVCEPRPTGCHGVAGCIRRRSGFLSGRCCYDALHLTCGER
jgi:hypothetical protein